MTAPRRGRRAERLMLARILMMLGRHGYNLTDTVYSKLSSRRTSLMPKAYFKPTRRKIWHDG